MDIAIKPFVMETVASNVKVDTISLEHTAIAAVNTAKSVWGHPLALRASEEDTDQFANIHATASAHIVRAPRNARNAFQDDTVAHVSCIARLAVKTFYVIKKLALASMAAEMDTIIIKKHVCLVQSDVRLVLMTVTAACVTRGTMGPIVNSPARMVVRMMRVMRRRATAQMGVSKGTTSMIIV